LSVAEVFLPLCALPSSAAGAAWAAAAAVFTPAPHLLVLNLEVPLPPHSLQLLTRIAIAPCTMVLAQGLGPRGFLDADGWGAWQLISALFAAVAWPDTLQRMPTFGFFLGCF